MLSDRRELVTELGTETASSSSDIESMGLRTASCVLRREGEVEGYGLSLADAYPLERGEGSGGGLVRTPRGLLRGGEMVSSGLDMERCTAPWNRSFGGVGSGVGRGLGFGLGFELLVARELGRDIVSASDVASCALLL